MNRTSFVALIAVVLAGCGAETARENASSNHEVAPSNPPKSEWTPLSASNGDSIIEVRQGLEAKLLWLGLASTFCKVAQLKASL